MGSFADRRKQAEQDGLLGSGDYLKLKEGANRMRLLSECLPHPGMYQGKKTFKWLCYVVDRVDQKVKPFFMPHTIYKQIEALQGSEDYAFQDVPMPYDLTVQADGAGTKDVKYTLLPARKNSSVTGKEMDDLKALKPLDDLQKALREKNGQKADESTGSNHGHDDELDGDPHSGPLTDDQIPF